jgi:hypothetical protein
MNMKIFTILIINISFLVFGYSLVPGQSSQPSVYLTFEKTGKFELLCANKSQEGIWLRLHNNTRWAINLDAQPAKNDNSQKSLLRLSDGTEVDGLADGTEVDACYDVEAIPLLMTVKKGNTIILDSPVTIPTPKVDFYCSCKWRAGRTQEYKGIWISAGSSVLLSVPQKALTKDLMIYTLFNYEWESVSGKVKRDEPQHKVLFYASDLPAKLQ